MKRPLGRVRGKNTSRRVMRELQRRKWIAAITTHRSATDLAVDRFCAYLRTVINFPNGKSKATRFGPKGQDDGGGSD